MTQVHYVKRAAKDYPHAGVKKGEPYFWWQHFRLARQVSKERPKPSQVASSDYARAVLAAVEELERLAVLGETWTEGERDELVGRLEEIREQEQDKYDNMPEGLQQGDTGVLLEERVESLDEWIGELESIDFPEEGADGGEESGEETPLEQALASAPSV